ncbi:hypothetical protein RB595_006291 [Gaeumannomyces hyphopodioides]
MPQQRVESERVDPSPLGQPLKFEFSGKTAKNRFLKAAMTERLSTWDPKELSKRGVPTPELARVYRRWGEGGFGVILSGNVMIAPDQLEGPGNPIIPADAPFSGERFEAFKEVAAQAKKHGSLFIAQVSHPGRQVWDAVNPAPISPSDVTLEGKPMGLTFAKPRPMEKKDFDEVIGGFAHAAEYLYKAGYDGIELHGAHGYLLAQFLSPTTNKRTDQYGGSLENRSRIILEIASAIRERVPDQGFSLSIKLNSVEFQDGGFSPDDCKALCAALDKQGFDFVELSGGTYEASGFKHHRESSKKREAFFLDFADAIAPELTKTKCYVTGGLRSVAGMVRALDTVHGVGLGRPVTHEPDLPAKILAGTALGALGVKIDEQDIGLSVAASGLQIKLVGRDKQPLDLTDDRHMGVLYASLAKFGQEMAENVDNSKYGFPDPVGFEVQPYGTPYNLEPAS